MRNRFFRLPVPTTIFASTLIPDPVGHAMTSVPLHRDATGERENERVLAEIARLLSGLRYGSIEVQVHDGVVTQIERRERVRLPVPGTPRPVRT